MHHGLPEKLGPENNPFGPDLENNISPNFIIIRLSKKHNKKCT
jgi:hypothetical protein